MRLLALLIVAEISLVSLVLAISMLRDRDLDPADRVGSGVSLVAARPKHQEIERRQRDIVVSAFQSARSLFERRLRPAEKNAELKPDLEDAILRIEGIYDPTRIGLFGPAMRWEVRPGTASMTDLSSGRWTRLSIDPNLHRRVQSIAIGWLHPPVGPCSEFWKSRRDGNAVMLDSLTTDECDGLHSKGPSDLAFSIPVVVEGRLSLPAFAAPYPGNRLSGKQLLAEQQARMRLVLQNRWFKGRQAIVSPAAAR